MVEVGLIELGAGVITAVVLNNFIGWYIWRYLDNNVAKHLDRIEERIKSLNVGIKGDYKNGE